MELGATVVREVAKLSAASRFGMSWDEQQQLFRVVLPPAGGGSSPEEPFFLEAGLVRRNDTSARSISEWTGEALGGAEVPEGIKPIGVAPMGNYAAQIQWEDGFSQVRDARGSNCSMPGAVLRKGPHIHLYLPSLPAAHSTEATPASLHPHSPGPAPPCVCVQVAPYELLRSLKAQAVEPAILEVGGVKVTVEMQ